PRPGSGRCGSSWELLEVGAAVLLAVEEHGGDAGGGPLLGEVPGGDVVAGPGVGEEQLGAAAPDGGGRGGGPLGGGGGGRVRAVRVVVLGQRVEVTGAHRAFEGRVAEGVVLADDHVPGRLDGLVDVRGVVVAAGEEDAPAGARRQRVRLGQQFLRQRDVLGQGQRGVGGGQELAPGEPG